MQKSNIFFDIRRTWIMKESGSILPEQRKETLQINVPLFKHGYPRHAIELCLKQWQWEYRNLRRKSILEYESKEAQDRADLHDTLRNFNGRKGYEKFEFSLSVENIRIEPVNKSAQLKLRKMQAAQMEHSRSDVAEIVDQDELDRRNSELAKERAIKTIAKKIMDFHNYAATEALRKRYKKLAGNSAFARLMQEYSNKHQCGVLADGIMYYPQKKDSVDGNEQISLF